MAQELMEILISKLICSFKFTLHEAGTMEQWMILKPKGLLLKAAIIA